jgi:hypothetical protein
MWNNLFFEQAVTVTYRDLACVRSGFRSESVCQTKLQQLEVKFSAFVDICKISYVTGIIFVFNSWLFV